MDIDNVREAPRDITLVANKLSRIVLITDSWE